MGTTYKATLAVRCWKEHTCLNCGGKFAYLFERKVVGQAATEEAASESAQTLAATTVANEVDAHPCPTCGLYQPEMVGAQRHLRHGWVLLAASVYLVVLGILFLTDVTNYDFTIWLAVGGGALAVLANLVIDWRNPNSDPQGNQQVARRTMDTGRLQQSQEGESKLPPPELFAPSRSTGHILALVILFLAPVVIALPELVRNANGWPLNPEWWPPVAGPKDETLVYLPGTIRSVKGYWNGVATVHAAVADGPNAAEFAISAESKRDNWGMSISAKSSESSSGSTPWVKLKLPDNASLVGKTLKLKIDLKATFPVKTGATFKNEQASFNRTAELQVAPASAGKSYNSLWWWGFLGGGSLLLAANIGLIRAATSLKKQALPTSIYRAQ